MKIVRRTCTFKEMQLNTKSTQKSEYHPYKFINIISTLYKNTFQNNWNKYGFIIYIHWDVTLEEGQIRSGGLMSAYINKILNHEDFV